MPQHPPAFPSSPGASPYPQYNTNSPVGGPPTYFTPPSPNMHYGEAPRRQPRRYKTSKYTIVIKKVWGIKILIVSTLSSSSSQIDKG
jgi:chitin synthase